MVTKPTKKDPFRAKPISKTVESEPEATIEIKVDIEQTGNEIKLTINQHPTINRIVGIPPMEYRIESLTGVPCIDWLPQTIGDSMVTMGGQYVEFAFNHPTDFTVYAPSGARLERM